MRSIAWALALFIAVIAAADPLCCPDGCERGGITILNHAQTGVDCPACQAASGVAISPDVTPPTIISRRSAPPVQPLSTGTATQLEHPPRF